ncbi:MAG: carbohydrate ABC transporter permease [Chloroflexi bacterium]|uniref:Carbohydrate ABC transporter permease n=1 Tax=Candidatus Chlorohelix allophototropha TaxID=3003348 RepID=A0A8T7M7H1_9CHLR|nr:carbohydrate ABC transporter permease [Chloroflexota bacterium]WJW68019.1 carbohydrate ABC transporter permease [Chloroflexota bacterium L227-S17]
MAAELVNVKGRSKAVSNIWWKVPLWLALIITTIISLFPMYWLFVTALTPTKDTIKIPPDIIPVNASLENFNRLFSQAKYYSNWAINSFVITLTITVFHVAFDTLSGYAFAKKKFFGRNVLFWLVLSTLMIPPHVTLTPLYFVVQNFGLRDNLLAVIMPGTASVFGIFLMRQFIQTLPTELEEAGRIDGCSEWGVFWRIIAPLSKPAIGALAIFTFVRYWNDYLWPSMVLIKAPSQTLPVGVASLQTEFATDYGLIFSGASLAALPMIIFFLLFQRYFLEGVRMGAIKG